MWPPLTPWDGDLSFAQGGAEGPGPYSSFPDTMPAVGRHNLLWPDEMTVYE